MKLFILISVFLFGALIACDAGADYTIVRLPDGQAVVTREIATPSGDWVLTLKYTYAKGGELKELVSEYGTVNGYDSDTSEFHPTSCKRLYVISEKRELTLKSEIITDAKSGKVVKRTFWEPEVEHWMSIKDLPLKSEK